MSIKLPRPVEHKTKDQIIEARVRRAYKSVHNKKYLQLKEDSSQRRLCEGIRSYLSGNSLGGCIEIYSAIGISKYTVINQGYREKVKNLLRELQNPQIDLFNTYKK